MTHRIRILLVLFLPGAAGCAVMQKSVYEGPFEAGNRYVADVPLSVWVGDTFFVLGPGSGEMAASPVRQFRDPVVLPPGIPLEFVRKDSPYLVFLVNSGEHAGRYAWIAQHDREVKQLIAEPLPQPPPSP